MNTAYRHHDRNYAHATSAAPSAFYHSKLLVCVQNQRTRSGRKSSNLVFVSHRSRGKQTQVDDGELWFLRLFANLLSFQAHCRTKEIIYKWLHLRSLCVRSLNNSSFQLTAEFVILRSARYLCFRVPSLIILSEQIFQEVMSFLN
jgi:hypothetical protein